MICFKCQKTIANHPLSVPFHDKYGFPVVVNMHHGCYAEDRNKIGAEIAAGQSRHAKRLKEEKAMAP